MRHHDLVGESGKELAKIVDEGPTFVRYHMPGCGHCIAMEKDWDELRNAGHKGIEFVNVESSALAHVPEHLKQGIDGFPMLVSYAKGGADRIEYTGERTAKGMEEWLKEHGRIGKQLGGARRSRKHHKAGRRSRHSRKHIRRTRGKHSRKHSRKHSLRHKRRSSKRANKRK